MANTVTPKLSGVGSNINVKTYQYGGSLQSSYSTSIFNNYEEIDYNYVEKDTKPTTQNTEDNKVADFFKATGATVAVGATSVLSGPLKLAEYLVDGGAWICSKIFFWNKDLSNTYKEFINEDLVGTAKQKIFEDTKGGRWLNEHSKYAYDSEKMKKLTDYSEKASEFIAATAVTIGTGGTAAPAVAAALVGTTVGLGSNAEKTYNQKGINTNWKDELKITGLGALNGLKWMMNGKIGNNLVNMASLSKLVGKAQVLSQIKSEVFTIDFLKNSLKRGLLSKRAIFNYVGSMAHVAPNVISIIKGDEKLTFKTGAKIAGKFLGILALSVFSDSVREYLNDFAVSEEGAKIIAARLVDPNDKLSIRDLKWLNRRDLRLIYGNMTDEQKLNALFEEAQNAANGKYNGFFRNFREHAGLHSAAVRDYATELGAQCGFDSEDMAVLYYSAQGHDFGMKGAGMFFDEDSGKWLRIDEISKDSFSMDDLKDFLKKEKGVTDFDKYMLENYGISNFSEMKEVGQLPSGADELVDDAFSFKVGNITRGNHPMNSAIEILTGDAIPDGVDKNRAALLALSHSKSTSGISDLSDQEQWGKSVAKLKQAMIDSGEMTQSQADDMEKELMKIVNNNKEFDVLRKQAICLRDADAMSEVVMQDGRIVMQTGESVKVVPPKVDSVDSGFPSKQEEWSNIEDKVYNSDGTPKIDPKTGQQVEITNGFSKGVHAGESNVSFGSTFDGKKYSATIEVADPLVAPNSTVSAIDERVAEVATYGGDVSNRPVTIKIDVPKNSELGKAYYKELSASFESAEKKLVKKGADPEKVHAFYEQVKANIEWA